MLTVNTPCPRGRIDLLEQQIDRMIDSRPAGSEAEIFLQDTRELPLLLQQGKVSDICWRNTIGVGLRYIRDGVIGFASASAGSDVDALISAATQTLQLKASRHSPASAHHARIMWPDEKVSPGRCSLPYVGNPGPEQMVDMAQGIYGKLSDYEGEMDYSVRLSSITNRIRIINSLGLDRQRRTNCFSMAATAVEGDDFGGLYEGWVCSGAPADFEGPLRRLKHWISLRNSQGSVKGGSIPVVFTSKALRFVMYALALALDGESVARGTSPLSGISGDVASPVFSLWDRPELKNGARSRDFDDEGVKCRDLALIEKGKLRCFLHDIKSASQAGIASTGNGVRNGGYSVLPSPGCSNLWIEPGESSLEDMIQMMGEGLLVDQPVGVTSGDIRTGAFAGAVHNGYSVRGGVIEGRVRGAMICGNVFSMLKGIQAIGSETIPGWHGYSPPMLISGVQVKV